jgi:glutaminase
MFAEVDVDEITATEAVSTGHLPSPDEVARSVRAAYQRYQTLDEGVVVGYIPALGRVSRDLFGICITLADGGLNPVTRQRVIDPVNCNRVLASRHRRTL